MSQHELPIRKAIAVRHGHQDNINPEKQLTQTLYSVLLDDMHQPDLPRIEADPKDWGDTQGHWLALRGPAAKFLWR
jgi:hypothetical protein